MLLKYNFTGTAKNPSSGISLKYKNSVGEHVKPLTPSK